MSEHSLQSDSGRWCSARALAPKKSPCVGVFFSVREGGPKSGSSPQLISVVVNIETVVLVSSAVTL